MRRKALAIAWRWASAAMAATLVGFVSASAQQPPPEAASGWTPKQAVHARRFMVAAANPLAVEAGHGILKAGGSAIDAAIAVQMVLNLVEPQSSGIGGGAFLLHHAASGKRLVTYDGRETAPAAARPERFLDAKGMPLKFHDAAVGGRSVGVPGVLAMLELAHRRHGRLPWASLFAPAIEIAERGFAISPRLAGALRRDADLAKEPGTRAYFFHPEGRPRAAGEILKNPEFALVLRRVAKEGARAFYEGEIARDIVAAVRGHARNPGDLSEEDLAAYRPKTRLAVCGKYHRYRVCGMPPPSSGGIAVLQILGLLERFELAQLSPESLLATHLIAEAGRLAFADRNRYVADPDFVPQVKGLTEPGYLLERSRLIALNASMGKALPGIPPAARKLALGEDEAPELPATSHISVVDRQGNAVAMTTSIENGFGSRLMVHGFLLNNQLTDFSFRPSDGGFPVANRVEAGKRPRSSMAPTIVYDPAGRIKMVTGSPGGSAIINYVAKSLIGVLDWRLDAQAAIELPNVGSRNGPTELERGTRATELSEKLRALGHEVEITEFNSGLHSIVREGRHWVGGADPRREGRVHGG